MLFLKSAPLFAIKAVTTISSLWAVNKVEKIVEDYASAIGFTAGTQPTPKDFFELVSKASDILRATQKPKHVAKFYVAMFHKMHDMKPKKMFDAFLNYPYQDDLTDAVYDFAHKNQHNSKILDRSFEAFLAIGTSKAYDCALALSGKNDKEANILINEIMRPSIDNQVNLLSYCLEVNTSSDIQEKVFAALCELSKSEDGKIADPAEDKVVKMLYEYGEGDYPNIARLAPVLEDIARKNSVPAALQYLLGKISNPKKGLEDYVEATASHTVPQNPEETGSRTAINLREVFERIDARNAEDKQIEPMADVYKTLEVAALARQAAYQKHIAGFHIRGNE